MIGSKKFKEMALCKDLITRIAYKTAFTMTTSYTTNYITSCQYSILIGREQALTPKQGWCCCAGAELFKSAGPVISVAAWKNEPCHAPYILVAGHEVRATQMDLIQIGNYT